MKLVVVLDFRFVRTPDGEVWTRTTYPRSFWNRYLKVFDQVRVVARAEPRKTVDSQYKAVTSPEIEFAEVPYYLGPWQYLQVRAKVRRSVVSATSEHDAVLCRVGSRLATDLLPSFWKSGRPYGLEVVGDPYEAFAPDAVKHPLRIAFRYLSAWTLRKQCARATAVSYVTREILQRRYPASGHRVGISDAELDNASFVGQPRTFTTFFSSIEATKDDYVLNPRSYTHQGSCERVVFVGSLEQMYKAPDVLLRAVAELQRRRHRVELTIVGDGRHRRDLQQLARELGISEAVTFAGELPSGPAIREHLDRAVLFVLPSRTEGMPRAMIEAMCRALPCIGSNAGGIPELLEPDDIVPAGDAFALADKIDAVLSDPGRLTRMSKRNFIRAQEFHGEVLEPRRTAFYSVLRENTEKWLGSRGRPTPSHASIARS
jgi:glycosyltransferase involved in cell wall biosynthesis